MNLPTTGGKRRLTDLELMSTQFRHTNPEGSIADLGDGVPDPDAHPTIIGYYDETPHGGRRADPPHPFVRCSHCGMRRHWKGHVVRDDRGLTYLIGARSCGRDHYGLRYEFAERAFKTEQARCAVLSQWSGMTRLLPAYRSELADLRHAPFLRTLELKREEIRHASPEGFRRLAQIARTS